MAESNNDGSGDANMAGDANCSGDANMAGDANCGNDDATAKGGNVNTEWDVNGREVKERLIQIEFTAKHNDPSLKKVYQTHTKLLTLLMRSNLINHAIDNKNDPVMKNFDVAKFAIPTIHQSLFKMMEIQTVIQRTPCFIGLNLHSVCERSRTMMIIVKRSQLLVGHSCNRK
jgi:hypothetical protein